LGGIGRGGMVKVIVNVVFDVGARTSTSNLI